MPRSYPAPHLRHLACSLLLDWLLGLRPSRQHPAHRSLKEDVGLALGLGGLAMEDSDRRGVVLASLVGAVAVYSAMLEYVMDGMVHCIYNCVDGGKKGYGTEP